MKEENGFVISYEGDTQSIYCKFHDLTDIHDLVKGFCDVLRVMTYHEETILNALLEYTESIDQQYQPTAPSNQHICDICGECFVSKEEQEKPLCINCKPQDT